MKYPKFKVYCKICKKLRIIQLLYKTTKIEREIEAKNYVCSDHDKK
jgi:hypothetical protein